MSLHIKKAGAWQKVGESGAVYVKVAGAWIPLGYAAPNAPVAGPVTPVGGSGLSVAWTTPTAGDLPITGYDVQQSADGSTGWTASAGSPFAASPASISGLTAGQTLHFRVRAKNAEGFGAWSNVVSGTTSTFNEATGGSTTDIPNYNGTGQTWRVHTFTAAGTFTVTSAPKPFKALVVAGGGGGGSAGAGSDRNGMWFGGGGGGAGGMLEDAALTIPVGAHAVAVGAGGGGGPNPTNGGNSAIGTLLTAIGGGYGAWTWPGQVVGASSGGSGGGAGFYENSLPIGQGSGTAGQGNAGGPTQASGNYYRTDAGGGGGAGGPGVPGAGGPGKASDITGTSVVYSVGGLGGTSTPGGGGAHGGYNAPPDPSLAGGAGRAGIVAIAYQIG